MSKSIKLLEKIKKNNYLKSIFADLHCKTYELLIIMKYYRS